MAFMYSQDNIESLYQLLAHAAGTDIFHAIDYDAVITQPSFWPNMIYNPRFNGESLIQRIKELKSATQTSNCPKYIMSNPGETSEELLSKMRDLNLKIGHWTAMHRTLQKLPEHCHPTLKISEVRDSSELVPWLDVLNEALMKESKADVSMFENILSNGNIQILVGTLNGEPVATSMSYTHEGTCGIYLVATLEPFRGLGIGRDMTLKAMKIGKELGCRQATLQSTNMGLSVYRNLEFEDCGEIEVFDVSKSS
jgi:GNAT superfamily N-acetyltransferase